MGITWITGNSNSGKTTTSNALKVSFEAKGDSVFIIDGGLLRNTYKKKLGFSKEERWKHNINIAKMALEKLDKYDLVIVAAITPYKELRKKIKELTSCKFIYMEGGREEDAYYYDHPELY